MRALVIICSFVLVFLTACDNRSDYWAEIDYNGSFALVNASGDTLTSLSGVYSDSVKTNHSRKYSYSILSAQDCNLSFEYDSTKGDVELDLESQVFNVTSASTGDLTVNFTITDPFGRLDERSLEVQSNDNQLPVAAAEVSLLGNVSAYEIEIDASGSYDADATIGGELIAYEYEIVDVCTDSVSLSSYKRILQDTGTYTIKVRVLDNDKAWSSKQVYTFKVE